MAKEFNENGLGVSETFAATPLAEMLNVLVSRCTTAASGGKHKIKDMCIMTNNVRRAYFYAEVRSDIYI